MEIIIYLLNYSHLSFLPKNREYMVWHILYAIKISYFQRPLGVSPYSKKMVVAPNFYRSDFLRRNNNSRTIINRADYLYIVLMCYCEEQLLHNNPHTIKGTTLLLSAMF